MGRHILKIFGLILRISDTETTAAGCETVRLNTVSCWFCWIIVGFTVSQPEFLVDGGGVLRRQTIFGGGSAAVPIRVCAWGGKFYAEHRGHPIPGNLAGLKVMTYAGL